MGNKVYLTTVMPLNSCLMRPRVLAVKDGTLTVTDDMVVSGSWDTFHRVIKQAKNPTFVEIYARVLRLPLVLCFMKREVNSRFRIQLHSWQLTKKGDIVSSLEESYDISLKEGEGPDEPPVVSIKKTE